MFLLFMLKVYGFSNFILPRDSTQGKLYLCLMNETEWKQTVSGKGDKGPCPWASLTKVAKYTDL